MAEQEPFELCQVNKTSEQKIEIRLLRSDGRGSFGMELQPPKVLRGTASDEGDPGGGGCVVVASASAAAVVILLLLLLFRTAFTLTNRA